MCRTVIVPHIFESSSAVATSFGADAMRIAQFATSVLLLLPQAVSSWLKILRDQIQLKPISPPKPKRGRHNVECADLGDFFQHDQDARLA